MMRGLRAAADLLLPRVCVVCGRKLHLDEEHLCLMCWAELPLTHFWERTHNRMADKFNELMGTALNPSSDYTTNHTTDIMRSSKEENSTISYMRERYAYAAALFFYDGAGTFRRIPHQLKYHANLSLGRKFGRLLGQKLRLAGHLCDVDLVIPVPLHWTRRWKRGYNQAEVIAAEVARVLGIEMRTDILKRSRRTRTQTKVDPRNKSANVTGAFTAIFNNSDIRHILLIDDVFTSGSTLMACFTALRAVFPPSVRISVATLAYVGGA